MPIAEIIAIGTELLLGETQDTNTSYLARLMRNNGVDLFRATIVGDNPERIARVIRDALQRAEIVITTGGLGPTVDDATRQGAALAFNVDTRFHPDLWQAIQERFQRYGRKATENNRRQAHLPKGAVAIQNQVGSAPAFYIESDDRVVICLPGVPREMEHLLEHAVLPYLKEKYALRGVIKSRLLHAAGVGESVIDEHISDLEAGTNPTVGLSAHAGQIDIRITAKANTAEEADTMIDRVADEVQNRLGKHLYGSDADTLEGVIANRLAANKWKLAVVECGLSGTLTERLKRENRAFSGSEIHEHLCHPSLLRLHVQELRTRLNSAYALGVDLQPGTVNHTIHLVLVTPDEVKEATRTYGGPAPLVVAWANNLALDFLRRCLP